MSPTLSSIRHGVLWVRFWVGYVLLAAGWWMCTEYEWEVRR